MNFIKHIRSDETGETLILSLIILAVGCITITPLLNLMSTGAKSTTIFENKMNEAYACDAGMEDAVHKMIKNVPSIQALGDGDSWNYTLPPINGIPVTVNITKKCLLDGLLGSNEFKIGQPHVGCVSFEVIPSQIIRNYEENWVEYCCSLDFEYTGGGNRKIESVGVFFAPFPGDADLIGDPYDIDYIPVITSNNLESIQKRVGTGGFAFIWRWLNNKGPKFNTDDTGSICFKFKVNDADWEYLQHFVWATYKEQDISYITDSQLNYWSIQASAGQNTTNAAVFEDESCDGITFLAWGKN